MVLSGNKCHFLRLGKNTENETFEFHNIIFDNSEKEKIPGITIDNKTIS